jgi:hypothetical protein
MLGRLAVAASIWLMAGCSAATNAPPATSATSPTATPAGVMFTGAVSGTMTSMPGFEPSCQLPFPGEVPPGWVYRVLGTVDVYHGVAFEIGVDDYKGPAPYRNSAVSIVILGPIGSDLKTSVTFESTGNATLIVNADELSGTIEATLRPHPSYPGGIVSPATVHVQGTFSCRRLKPAATP